MCFGMFLNNLDLQWFIIGLLGRNLYVPITHVVDYVEHVRKIWTLSLLTLYLDITRKQKKTKEFVV